MQSLIARAALPNTQICAPSYKIGIKVVWIGPQGGKIPINWHTEHNDGQTQEFFFVHAKTRVQQLLRSYRIIIDAFAASRTASRLYSVWTCGMVYSVQYSIFAAVTASIR